MSLIEVLVRFFRMSFGIYGPPTVITGTSAYTNLRGTCFTAVGTGVTIASITINGTAITDFSAITLAQGQCLYGNITAVTLSAGVGMVYNGQNIG